MVLKVTLTSAIARINLFSLAQLPRSSRHAEVTIVASAFKFAGKIVNQIKHAHGFAAFVTGRVQGSVEEQKIAVMSETTS
jgi:hypothetical protein